MKWNPRDFCFKRLDVRQAFPNVFVFDLFKPSLCERILGKFHASDRKSAPNSMNKYGADVADLGLQSWTRKVMQFFVSPFAVDYFPEVTKMKPSGLRVSTLRNPYGFIVHYDCALKQKKLDAHIDESSDLTLNVCLNNAFDGGDLVFYGPRGEKNTIEHFQGRAIVHRGHHVHRAMPLNNGIRTNLILWCA